MFNSWRSLLCGIIFMLLAFGGACKKKDSTPPTPHQEGELAAAITTQADPLNITLAIAPEHPRMIKPTTFTLHVTDPAGKISQGLAITGHLTMRDMNMGETQITLVPKGGGDYQASVKEMDMSGPWTLTVKASSEEGRMQKSFDFVVEE